MQAPRGPLERMMRLSRPRLQLARRGACRRRVVSLDSHFCRIPRAVDQRHNPSCHQALAVLQPICGLCSRLNPLVLWIWPPFASMGLERRANVAKKGIHLREDLLLVLMPPRTKSAISARSVMIMESAIRLPKPCTHTAVGQSSVLRTAFIVCDGSYISPETIGDRCPMAKNKGTCDRGCDTPNMLIEVVGIFQEIKHKLCNSGISQQHSKPLHKVSSATYSDS